MNAVNIFAFIALLLSCSSNKKMYKSDELPECLKEKIKMMRADSLQGAPLAIVSYTYKNKIVYYLKESCCDKYNTVYDSACNVLGHPDGGFTGRGDGTLADFKETATNKKVIWQRK